MKRELHLTRRLHGEDAPQTMECLRSLGELLQQQAQLALTQSAMTENYIVLSPLFACAANTPLQSDVTAGPTGRRLSWEPLRPLRPTRWRSRAVTPYTRARTWCRQERLAEAEHLAREELRLCERKHGIEDDGTHQVRYIPRQVAERLPTPLHSETGGGAALRVADGAGQAGRGGTPLAPHPRHEPRAHPLRPQISCTRAAGALHTLHTLPCACNTRAAGAVYPTDLRCERVRAGHAKRRTFAPRH